MASTTEPMRSMEALKPELRLLVYEVNSIGINLNQLTRGMHNGKIVSTEALFKVLTVVAEQNALLQNRLTDIFKGIKT